MKYLPMELESYDTFYQLLVQYYRESEDEITPQDEMDTFVSCLFDLCKNGEISGFVVKENEPIGFCLWNVDTPDSPFSNQTGFGTILEICVCEKNRKKGIGKQIVAYAEELMQKAGMQRYYVCAYGPAVQFWVKCGYVETEKTATNGLKIYEKINENKFF